MNPRRLDRLTIRSTRSGYPGPSGAASSPVVLGHGRRIPGTGMRTVRPVGAQAHRHLVGEQPAPHREHGPVAAPLDEPVEIGVVGHHRCRHAHRRPQRQGEALERRLLVGEHLVGRRGGPPGAHGLDVALRGADVPPPAPAPVRVGRAPDAPVVALGPVQGVVAALVAGHGPVRHLVPPVPRRRQRAVDQRVAPGGDVVVGMPRRVARQGRAGLDGERVGAHVGGTGLEAEHGVEGGVDVGVGLGRPRRG